MIMTCKLINRRLVAIYGLIAKTLSAHCASTVIYGLIPTLRSPRKYKGTESVKNSAGCYKNHDILIVIMLISLLFKVASYFNFKPQ